MMQIDHESGGQWLRDDGAEHDVVISSRVRLARNLNGFNFTNRADEAQRAQIAALARQCTADIEPAVHSPVRFIDLQPAAKIDRNLLVERHLISRQLAREEGPAGLVVSENEMLAIMVNEEDHFRIQIIRNGLDLQHAYRTVREIDERLSRRLDFAFHERMGYLTACPTNVGTGIRVSVMFHLPALVMMNEIERVRRAARDMHLAIRGFYGEGSEALGDFFQVSNQTTLGRSEQELLDEFGVSVAPPLIDYERRAREFLVAKRTSWLDDHVFRAFGTLRYARMIKLNEAMKMLSLLRLGVLTGRIETLDATQLLRLVMLIQPAHLHKRIDEGLTQAQLAEARAALIRRTIEEGLAGEGRRTDGGPGTKDGASRNGDQN